MNLNESEEGFTIWIGLRKEKRETLQLYYDFNIYSQNSFYFTKSNIMFKEIIFTTQMQPKYINTHT